MDLNLFFGLVTLLAFAVAIYQYFQAKKSDQKLDEANESIKELEDGFLLSDYKLKKAIEFYEAGQFKNALEVFKKYSKESEDLSEFRETIRKIFWKETRKIYSKYMGHSWGTEILIMTIISKMDSINSTYPKFINDLLDIYTKMSEDKLKYWRIPILLNQEAFEEVQDYIPEYKAQNNSRNANKAFQDFLSFYCKKKLAEYNKNEETNNLP